MEILGVYTFCVSPRDEVLDGDEVPEGWEFPEGDEVPEGHGVIIEVCVEYDTYDGKTKTIHCIEVVPEDYFRGRVPLMSEKKTDNNDVTGYEYTITETCDEYFITFEDLKILSVTKDNQRWDYIHETRKNRYGEKLEEAESGSGSLRAFREATREASRKASVKAALVRKAVKEASVKAEAARAAFKAELEKATKPSL